MKLQLKRPIVWFDIESTGIDREKDRIIEISVCKLMPNMERITVTKRLNPEMPIPTGASEVHGIKDEDVADCPVFRQIAKSLLEFFEGCDVGGFNGNSFDVPMLYNEFQRCGIDWDYTKFLMIDPGNLFKIKEARTLSAAVKFYCEKELEGAHGAEADIHATVDVFLAQMDRYENDEGFPQTIEELALYTNYGKPVADISGKFSYNDDGAIILNFGTKKGELAKDNISYLDWMVNKANFPADTNRIASQVLEEFYMNPR